MTADEAAEIAENEAIELGQIAREAAQGTALEAAAQEVAVRTARRHPAAVTADRLDEHLNAYADVITPAERVSIHAARYALTQIPDRIRRLPRGGADL